MTPPLPAPRGTPYRIALVCLGNICRSPMAAVVLQQLVDEAGLGDQVEVTSAGTGDWHTGEPMDDRAAATLREAGLDPSSHRARHFDVAWFDRDLLLVMDASNLADVRALGGDDERVLMFRAFDPEGGPDAEVPDPWYGGRRGFDDVLAIVSRTGEALVRELERLLGERLP